MDWQPALRHSPLPARRPVKSITKLADCAHFHYPSVELGPVGVQLKHCDRSRVILAITSNAQTWHIDRPLEDMIEFDRQLHRCVFERRHSKLDELQHRFDECRLRDEIESYCDRLSELTGSIITCYPVLKFLEIDSRGERFSPAEYTAINTPAIAAAVVTKQFEAQQPDQLTIKVGDILSIIEMASAQQCDAHWWKAKLTIANGGDQRGFQIGYFPSDCVQLFDDKGLAPSPLAVHRKNHVNAARRMGELLKRRVRKKELVFGVDLIEHLQKNRRHVPLILEKCVEAIEKHGIVTGVYRQCGIQSNIQKLRSKFDSGLEPDLFEFSIIRDIYCVSSLLKQYFRQLPNPLFTFQLYDRLLKAFEQKQDTERLVQLKGVISELPDEHYKTASCLLHHLNRLCEHTALTDMTSKNLAIVWAPNLFRAPPSANGGDAHLLNGLNVHTSICNFLICNTQHLFPIREASEPRPSVDRIESCPAAIADKENGTDSRWPRFLRGKSVEGFLAGFGNLRNKKRDDNREEKVRWRRSQSSDAFNREARSESLMSTMSRGLEDIRHGYRHWRRARSQRPASRPPASPFLGERRSQQPMQESGTMSYVSSEANTTREDSVPSSSSGATIEPPATQRRVAFSRENAIEHEDVVINVPDERVPIAERSSPVEEWSSDSRDSPLLEMSRYDNVPSRIDALHPIRAYQRPHFL